MRAVSIGILITGIHYIWFPNGSCCSQRTRCMHSCPSCRVLDPLFPGAFCPRVDRLGLLARVPLSAAPSPQLDGALHALPELWNHFQPLCVFALPPVSLMLFVVTVMICLHAAIGGHLALERIYFPPFLILTILTRCWEVRVFHGRLAFPSPCHVAGIVSVPFSCAC